MERVVIHTPGPEIEAMTPSQAEQDLYNDIIPLSSVLGEFSQLKAFLSLVTEVGELVDLLAFCLQDVGDKYEFLTELGRCFPIRSSIEDLMMVESGELAARVVRGIPAPKNSLARILDPQAFLSRPLPNAYFMRDSAAVVGDCAVSAATAYDVRMVEAVITKFIFTHHPDYMAKTLLFDGPSERNRYSTIEGGDIIVLGKNLYAIGVSERTTPFAIERLARNAARISESDVTIFAVELPRSRATIHLDMVFTVIDADAALVYEPVILGPGRGRVVRIEARRNGKLVFSEESSLLEAIRAKGLDMEPVLCGNGHRLYQEREQWLSGANSFAFAPGKVLVYSCNSMTAEALSNAGFEIQPSRAFLDGSLKVEDYGRLAVTFDGIELARGGGGARCMTLPVQRKDP